MLRKRLISPSRENLAQLRTPLTHGEFQVFQVLDCSLSPEWEIYLQPYLNGCRPDFILLNPNVGIGILEIKDWHFAAMNLRWQESATDHAMLFGTDKHGKPFRQRNPVAQLLQYKREILDIYCPRLDAKSGLAAISAGVIFASATDTDVQTLFGNRLPSRNEYVVGKEVIAPDQIGRLFPPSHRPSSHLMTHDHANDLRSWLIEPDHSSEQREPLPLDATQRTFASTRTQSGYRRIRGPAGTGKSVVLVARAVRLANDHRDVLVVTYNITILNFLRDFSVRLPAGRSNDITWLNFHALCKRLANDLDLAKEYKQVWNDHFKGGPDAFYTVPKALLSALATNCIPDDMRYDAIFVDEGQNFQPDWWELLRRLCRDGGEMILVADSTQDLYEKSRLWTDQAMTGAGFSGPWSELDTSYRLPMALLDLAAKFAERYLPKPGRLIPRSPQGELVTEPCALRWVQVEKGKVVNECVAELYNLIKTDERQSLAMTDLTLLVDNIDNGSKVVRDLEAMGNKTASTFDSGGDGRRPNSNEDRRRKRAFWKGEPRVKVSTIHSFVGWESRTYVLSITRANRNRDLAAIYTGLTRLKRHVGGSALTVVCSVPCLAEYGRLWPIFLDRTSKR